MHGSWASPDLTAAKTETGVTQHALYLEDAWRISNRWLAMAGLRRDVYDFASHSLVGGTDFDKTLAATSWRLGLTYELARNTHVYGQISSGHDPVNSLVSATHHRTGKPHGWIHSELRRRCGGPPIAAATREQIQDRIQALRQLNSEQSRWA